MRLDKYQKRAIVSSILRDTPRRNFDTLRVEIQEVFVKAMSPAVQAMYKTLPHALKTTRFGGDEGLDYGTVLIIGDLRDREVRTLLKPYAAAQEERVRTEHQLRGAIDSCNTLKQLNDRLPEFKKYYPAEEKPTKNLPALANVVADLSKLGWPATPGEMK